MTYVLSLHQLFAAFFNQISLRVFSGCLHQIFQTRLRHLSLLLLSFWIWVRLLPQLPFWIVDRLFCYALKMLLRFEKAHRILPNSYLCSFYFRSRISKMTVLGLKNHRLKVTFQQNQGLMESKPLLLSSFFLSFKNLKLKKNTHNLFFN